MHQELTARLKETGYDLVPNFSGEIIRFSRNGSKNSGWAYGKELKGFQVFRWGDFRLDESYEWVSSEARPEEFEVEWQKALEVERKEREARWLEVAREASEIFSKSLPYGEHPYLIEKGISGAGLFGARLSQDGKWLYVPLIDAVTGKQWSFQKIGPRGEKQFFEGGRVRGLYHFIEGTSLEAPKLFICEGFATGVSIFQALEGAHSVLCAMNCGNIESIAKDFSRPEADIIFCADNDQWTEGNPGVAACQAAQSILGRGKIVVPHFKNLEGKPTDFNDLAQREGLARVKEILLSEPTQLETLVKPARGRQKMSEHTVTQHILSYYAGELISCQKDFFKFTGTHWEKLTESDLNTIRDKIVKISGGSYDVRHIKGVLEHMAIYIEVDPKKIYVPNPYQANFLNGTLRAFPKPNRESGLVLEFGEHRKEDFCTSVIPLEYKENGTDSPEFLEMLNRVFDGDEDIEEKINAVSEMYGAAIMPIYPHFWLLWGQGGGGKSSLILPIYNLIGKQNICSVEPHEFKGFLMESMVGKLVNLVTDIDTSQPIADGNLKKVEDRVMVRIDRKFKLPIHAPLPATNIFGANEIPRTFSGGSKAHERRWTFIGLSKFQAKPGEYRKDFSEWLWARGADGILHFALKGLRRILANGGHFTTPKSGKETMSKWQKELDPISLFLEDLEEPPVQKELGICLLKEGETERQKVWEAFKKWTDNSAPAGRKFGKFAFYNALRDKKFDEKTIRGVRCFAGFQISGADSQSF